jgi:(2Fe-2S) ferredoxin
VADVTPTAAVCVTRSAITSTGEKEMADAPADPALFYARHIFMCTNVRPDGHPRGCCMARSAAGGGVDKLRGYMREKARALGIENIRCNAAGCLDRCEFGPNMVIYPEGVWYRYESTEDIDEILQKHLVEGGRVTRLMLQPDQRPPKH